MRDIRIDVAVDSNQAMRTLLEISDRMAVLLWWHLAAPLVDHDGGDEDDRLVEQRRFLRALRKPRSRYFRQRDRLYVVQEQEPEPRPLLPIRFNDPGDEQ